MVRTGAVSSMSCESEDDSAFFMSLASDIKCARSCLFLESKKKTYVRINFLRFCHIEFRLVVSNVAKI